MNNSQASLIRDETRHAMHVTGSGYQVVISRYASAVQRAAPHITQLLHSPHKISTNERADQSKSAKSVNLDTSTEGLLKSAAHRPVRNQQHTANSNNRTQARTRLQTNFRTHKEKKPTDLPIVTTNARTGHAQRS